MFYTKAMRIEQSERIEILKQTALFGYLNPGEMNRLAGLFKAVTYLEGETIFAASSPSEMMYIIFEGEVDLETVHKREERVFTTLHRGDYFGEESLYEDNPRFYSAVAASNVTLLALDIDSYLYIFPDLPDFEERLEVAVESRKLAARLPFPWLGQDEYPLVIARRHPAILWAREIASICAGLGALVAGFLTLLLWLPDRPYGWLIMGLGGGIGLLWSLWTYFDWRNDYFLLTNKRVVWIESVALIYDSRKEAPLRTIMSIGESRTRLGSLMGFSDVVVTTYVGTIRLHDLAHARLISSLIETYWHHADDFNRREEAELMDFKLRQKLDDLGYQEDMTRPAVTQRIEPMDEEPIREPGFMEWLFSDFIRLRYEANGAIIYRKHWFVLVRAAWLPVLLMLAMLGVVIARLTGSLTFIPLNSALYGLVALMFVDFLWILYQYADWRNDIFQVTLDQIIDFDRKPLGKMRKRTAPLENVLSIEYERRGFWGFVFNFGTVYITVGNTRLTFDFVYNPSAVQQDIFYRMGERLEKLRQFEIDSERERISEWIASYHRRVARNQQDDGGNPNPMESSETFDERG
ncbi:MAG: cyclic nucleotide-binding domain-containing protein [Anaerolineaceae bacterium]|nr:cyclic nucleotide-binding domain-containing protein [Anaerolineaceae bacterium]